MKLRIGSVLAVPAVLATVAASPASATETRINSMGGGVKLWTVEDESNIFDFPSLLTRWGNRVYVDNIVAAGTDQIPGGHFGFHYNLSDDTVIAFFGAHINSTTSGAPTDGTAGNSGFVGSGNPITGGLSLGDATGPFMGVAGIAGGAANGEAPNTNAEYRYGLMFATQLGASTRFGLSFHLSGENADKDSPNNVQTDTGSLLFDIGIGLGVDLSGSELELAAGIDVGLLESAADNQQTGVDLEDVWSGSHFGLRLSGRWTFDFFDQTKIVTYTQFLLASQSVEQVNTAAVPPRAARTVRSRSSSAPTSASSRSRVSSSARVSAFTSPSRPRRTPAPSRRTPTSCSACPSTASLSTSSWPTGSRCALAPSSSSTCCASRRRPRARPTPTRRPTSSPPLPGASASTSRWPSRRSPSTWR